MIETTRRGFLGGAAALGGAALVPLEASAAQPSQRPTFHLGLVTYMIGARMDLPALIRLCEQTGLEGLELRSTHKHGVEPTLDAVGRARVRQLFARTRVRLVGLGSACEFHSPERAVVEKNIALTKAFVDLAADVGAWGVKVRPNGLPSGVPEEKTLAQIAEALKRCGDYAERKKVVLFVECHGRGTSEPRRMARIMELCAHPQVCLCWNCNSVDIDRKSGSIRKNFELCQKWIRHAHIHDLYAGYPYREFFSLLKGIGFGGYTMVEAPPTSDPVRVLRYYRALWEALAS